MHQLCIWRLLTVLYWSIFLYRKTSDLITDLAEPCHDLSAQFAAVTVAGIADMYHSSMQTDIWTEGWIRLVPVLHYHLRLFFSLPSSRVCLVLILDHRCDFDNRHHICDSRTRNQHLNPIDNTRWYWTANRRSFMWPWPLNPWPWKCYQY